MCDICADFLELLQTCKPPFEYFGVCCFISEAQKFRSIICLLAMLLLFCCCEPQSTAFVITCPISFTTFVYQPLFMVRDCVLGIEDHQTHNLHSSLRVVFLEIWLHFFGPNIVPMCYHRAQLQSNRHPSRDKLISLSYLL